MSRDDVAPPGLTDEDIRGMLSTYEARHVMKSDEFARRWAAAELPDTWEFNDWAILLRHLRLSEA